MLIDFDKNTGFGDEKKRQERRKLLSENMDKNFKGFKSINDRLEVITKG